MNRVIFVDGPLSGTMQQLEGEPERTLYTPAIIASAIKWEQYDEAPSMMRNYVHMYGQRWKTRAGTLIYEYMGTQ